MSKKIHIIASISVAILHKKNALLEEKALANQRASEIRKCIADIEGMSGPLENFDESYVRKLITRINLFDDHLDFIFKNGQTITINE